MWNKASMLIDAEAREKIKNDLDHTYVVEASAGTGKTTLLVERILQILRTGKAVLPEIVAITFTEKAAAELKTRIRQKLGDYAPHETWAAQALAQIERAAITTIHSFCAGLLRAWPNQSGISADFSVSDEAAQRLFYQDTWRSWLNTQVVEDQPTLRRLLYLGVASDNIALMAQQLAIYRDLLPASFTPDWQKVSLAEWQTTVSEEVAACVALLPRCRQEEDAGYQHVCWLKRKWNYLATLEEAALSRRLIYGIAVRDRDGNQKHWQPPESLKEIKNHLKNIKEKTAAVHTALVHNLVQESLVWLRSFLAFYQEAKKKRNRLDFTDILILTRDLVKNDKTVRQIAGAEYRYLLIDEFQDTDPLQVEILFFLAEQEARADTWQDVKILPGKLFLVGDPKQSLYRFRRADIEIYEDVKRRLGDASLVLITQNFRARPAIIAWVNEVFSALIEPPPDGAYQPAYAPLYATRSATPAQPQVLFLTAAQPAAGTQNRPEATHDDDEEQSTGEQRLGGRTVSDIVAEEASVIAAMLCRIAEEKWPVAEKDGHERPFVWSDAAILLRRFSYLEVFEEALSRRHIPYEVMGEKPFYNRLEIKNLASLLRALAEPCDTQALIAALRSPIFSISDEEILLYRHSHGTLDYRFCQTSDALLERTLCLLHELHREVDTVSVPVLLSHIFAATAMPLTYLSMWQGEERAANLGKTITLAYDFRRREHADFRSFVHWLSEMEKAEAHEESVGANGSTPAVRIFSIHRAKGLEFPVVFLGDLAGKPKQLPEIIVNRAASTMAIKLRGRQDIKTSEYEEAKEWEKKRTNAEEIRLLYVAMTRARDYLLLPLAAQGRGYLGLLASFLPDAAAPVAAASQMVCEVSTSLPGGQTFSRLPDRFALPNLPSTVEAAATLERARRIGECTAIGQKPVTRRVVQLTDVFARPYGGKIATAVRHVLRFIEPLAGDDMFLPLEVAKSLGRERSRLALSQQEFAHAFSLITRAVASPLLLRAVRSKKIFREISWLFQLDGILLQGTIDLCFEERDGLVLVHYKSDTITKSQATERSAQYCLEAAAHTLAVQEIARAKVKENILFFWEPGVAVPCPLTADSLTEAKSAIHNSVRH
jgi:ATP-dependent exoDNAse (exonuclease V) beta subunit